MSPLSDTPLQLYAVICRIPRGSAEFLMSFGIVLRKEVFWYSVIVGRSPVVRGQTGPVYLHLALISRLKINRPSYADDTSCSLHGASAHTRHQTLALEYKHNCCSVQRASIAVTAMLCGTFPGFTPL